VRAGQTQADDLYEQDWVAVAMVDKLGWLRTPRRRIDEITASAIGRDKSRGS
jgi:hypothetical protein